MMRPISTKEAPAAVGPYSQAILSGFTVYTSGQVAINPATGKLVQDSIEAETQQVLDNLEAVLAEARMGFENVVKTTVFLTDIANFAAVNAVYAKAFKSDPPARSCVQVAALPLGARVEIECIATK
ncbi:MAG: RidA family protein [Phascolarctobacterium sp.]|nr:RidA family protein [Phascolarctobacterium sp.]